MGASCVNWTSGKPQARLLRHFPELVRALGGVPARILGRQGVAAEACEQVNAASYYQWGCLLESAARELGVPDFGLRLAQRQGGCGVYGQLGAVIRNSLTFGDALTYVVSHSSAHCQTARVWQQACGHGRQWLVAHDFLVEPLAERCQAIEQLLLLGHLGALALTGGRARVRQVRFRHGERAPVATYRRHFGCDVQFGCAQDGLVFDADARASRIRQSDALARETAAGVIGKGNAWRAPLGMQVRAMVLQTLATGGCEVVSIARSLGMHPRTLRRRLRAEASSFQRVKNQVRGELLLFYLQQTRLGFGAISDLLGFAEQSALSHFARQHLAASPRELRAAGEIVPAR